MLVDYRKRAERRQDFYEKIVRKCSVRTIAMKEKSNRHTLTLNDSRFTLFSYFFIFEKRKNAYRKPIQRNSCKSTDEDAKSIWIRLLQLPARVQPSCK